MVQIQPVTIWLNGENKEAVNFDLVGVKDNLINEAIFCYYLIDIDGILLTNNNLILNGSDYINYNQSENSIKFAYDWAAGKLNLIITSYEQPGSIEDIEAKL